jgi:hypothetical protein
MTLIRHASDIARLLSAAGKVAQAIVVQPHHSGVVPQNNGPEELRPSQPGTNAADIQTNETNRAPSWDIRTRIVPGEVDAGLNASQSADPLWKPEVDASDIQSESTPPLPTLPSSDQTNEALSDQIPIVDKVERPVLRSSSVPSGRFSRLLRYGGLAVGVGYGTATEAIKRAVLGPSSSEGAWQLPWQIVVSSVLTSIL